MTYSTLKWVATPLGDDYERLYHWRKGWAYVHGLEKMVNYTPPAMNWEPAYFALDRHWEYRFTRFLRKKWVMLAADERQYRRRRYP